MKRRVLGRTAWQLMRRHKLRIFMMMLVMACYAASFVLIQLLQGTIQNTMLRMRLDKYGHFTGVIVDVQPDLYANAALPDTGVMTISGQIPSATYGSPICIGTIDEAAQKMLGMELKSGRMPQHPDELALMYDSYLRLGADAEIGETITILVMTASGELAEQSFTLCGILYDYDACWGKVFGSLDGAYLPTALLYDTDSTSAMLLCGESYLDSVPQDWYGGQFHQNYYVCNGDWDEQTTQRIFAVTAITATVFLAVFLYFGIRSVTEIAYQTQRRSIQIFRCIGMTPAQILQILMIQGIALTAGTLLLSLLFGILLTWCIVSVMNRLGNQLFFAMPMNSLLIAAGIVIANVFSSYALQMRKLLRQSERMLTDIPKHKCRQYRTASALYRGTIGRTRHRRMRFNGVLIAVMSLLFLIGSYGSDMFANLYIADLEQEAEQLHADYAFLPIGGGTMLQYLNTEIKRDYGLTAEQLAEITNHKETAVALSITGDYAASFLLWDDREQHPTYLEEIRDKRSYRRTITEFPDLDADMILAQYGFNAEQDLIEADILGIPYAQLSGYADFLADGALHEDAFVSGAEAAFVHFADAESGYAVGDTVTVLLFDFPKDPVAAPPRITSYPVTISAVYTADGEMAQQMRWLDARGCLFISDIAMLNADSALRYSTVLVNQTDESDDTADIAESFLLDIFRHCEQGQFRFCNYTSLDRQRTEQARQYAAPFLFLTAMLLGVALVSYLITNLTGNLANSHSDAVLFAVGIPQHKQQWYLFRNDLQFLFTWSGIGCFVFLMLLAIVGIRQPVMMNQQFLQTALLRYILCAGMLFPLLAWLGSQQYATVLYGKRFSGAFEI